MTLLQFLINDYPIAAYNFNGKFMGDIETMKNHFARTHQVQPSEIKVLIKPLQSLIKPIAIN